MRRSRNFDTEKRKFAYCQRSRNCQRRKPWADEWVLKGVQEILADLKRKEEQSG